MATQVTVSGTLRDAAGVALTGTITFRPTQAIYDLSGELVVGTAPVVATLTAGAFSVVLYATDDGTTSPTGATYTVSEDLTGASGKAVARRYRCEIPSASATLRYEDITAAIPTSPATASYATAAAITAAVDAHIADDDDPHSAAGYLTSDAADLLYDGVGAAGAVATDLGGHTSATADVHGISDTSKLLTSDADVNIPANMVDEARYIGVVNPTGGKVVGIEMVLGQLGAVRWGGIETGTAFAYLVGSNALNSPRLLTGGGDGTPIPLIVATPDEPAAAATKQYTDDDKFASLNMAGLWVAPPAGSVGTFAFAPGNARAIPVWLPTGTLDTIGIECTVGATATTRLGIYTSTAGFLPGGLIAAAAVDPASPGNLTAAIEVDIEAGWHWLVAVNQGGTPTLRFVSTQAGGHRISNAFIADTGGQVAYTATITGALPNTFPAGAWGVSPPRVQVRYSA